MFFKNPAFLSDDEFEAIFNQRIVDAELLAIIQTQVVPLGQPYPEILLSDIGDKYFSGIDFRYEEYYV